MKALTFDSVISLGTIRFPSTSIITPILFPALVYPPYIASCSLTSGRTTIGLNLSNMVFNLLGDLSYISTVMPK